MCVYCDKVNEERVYVYRSEDYFPLLSPTSDLLSELKSLVGLYTGLAVISLAHLLAWTGTPHQPGLLYRFADFRLPLPRLGSCVVPVLEQGM